MSQALSLASDTLCRHRTAVAALLPIVAPAVYVAYLNWTVSRSVTGSTTGQLPRSKDAASTKQLLPAKPQSLPVDVVENPDEWVVSYERVVSLPLDASMLISAPGKSTTGGPSPLFCRYLHGVYRAFSWTPQAFLIRAMMAEPLRRESFSAKYINSLAFNEGDIVDGVYKVSHYGAYTGRAMETLELVLDTPSSYKGPPVRGLILSSIEPAPSVDGEDKVYMVNETWLWRGKDEKPSMLEGGLGSWFHTLLAGWLIKKGLAGLGNGD